LKHLGLIATFALMAQAQEPNTTKHAIVDPALQMNAFYVTAPANWKFDGAAVPGTTCQSMPTAAYKVSSPDGLSGVFSLPRFDWAWTTGRVQNQSSGEGCMPFQNISASQLLDYLVPIFGVAFEKEGDPAVVEQVRANMKRDHDQRMAQAGAPKRWSGDFARYIVRYEIDHHQVEEVLNAYITCQEQFDQQLGNHYYECSAFVTRLRAPAGKLQEQAALLTSVRDEVDPAWNRKWMSIWAQRMSQRMHDLYGPQTKAMLEAGREAGEARMRQHEAFMHSMQRQQDIRNERFVVGQYNKRWATDNFIDYITDCTRLRNGYSVGGNCQNRQTLP
jgi:hypothetical protein